MRNDKIPRFRFCAQHFQNFLSYTYKFYYLFDVLYLIHPMESVSMRHLICSYTLRFLVTFTALASFDPAVAQEEDVDTSYGDEMIQAYFDDQVRQIESGWLEDVHSLDDWERKRPQLQRELRQMLGLDPLPPRTELKATITGRLEHPDFTVEKLHFQSSPGLYVTANLYLPRNVDGPVPGVLYVCGHANIRTEDDVSLGAKTAYQRHPAWYARHGYACLIIDTVQLAEIEGFHHGSYRMDRWWWWNRGYTPEGVEVWNSMRALDYLASRPEVDAERLAVTGRSGGGAYSWFLTALDDRIKVTVPTAGITDLRDHVLDGVIAGHCDCMYMVNTYRWDFPTLAALAAPRPTLVANGDVDPIFPYDGVMRTFHKARQVYALCQRLNAWDVLIVPAGHDDTHPLQQGTFAWMHHFLKNEPLTSQDSVISFFEPEQLKVFDRLPEDEINTRIDELFIEPAPEPELPASWNAWQEMRQSWRSQLDTLTFGGWPSSLDSLRLEKAYTVSTGGLRFSAYDFDSQTPVRLRMWIVQEEDAQPEKISLSVLDDVSWQQWLSVLESAAGRDVAEALVGPGARSTVWPTPDDTALVFLRERLQRENEALAFVAPRGIGPTRWTESERGYRIRRSFVLLGQTRDGMRVWDVRRTIQALRSLPAWQNARLQVEAEGVLAGISLYAAIYEPGISSLQLKDLPATHREGPILLNVRKVLDLPQALAMALEDERTITIYGDKQEAWRWPRAVARLSPSGENLLQLEPGTQWQNTAVYGD